MTPEQSHLKKLADTLNVEITRRINGQAQEKQARINADDAEIRARKFQDELLSQRLIEMNKTLKRMLWADGICTVLILGLWIASVWK